MRFAALVLATLVLSASVAPSVMACMYKKPTVAQSEIPKKQDGQGSQQSTPAQG